MASDPQRQADISDAHHEGFGAGVAWADQTPDTGDGALDLGAVRERQHATTGPHAWIGSEAHWDAIIASLADVPDLVDEVVALRQSLTELVAERDRLRAEYVDVCETVAQMHAAAVGEVRGPIRGVVEDVADLRAELGRLRAELDDVRDGAAKIRRVAENLAAKRDTLTARLAEAGKVVERVLGRHAAIGTLCEADEYELRRWYDQSSRAETTE